MLKYKLTTQGLTTYLGFKWEIGKKVTTSGEGGLCSDGWLHYYHHPLLAVLLNPIHSNISQPKLFEVEAEGIHKSERGFKGGCTEMTLIKETPLPEITRTQKIAFAILCAKEVCKDEIWVKWADDWLNNVNRDNQSILLHHVTFARRIQSLAATYAAEAATFNDVSDAVAHTAYAIRTFSIDLQSIAEKAMTCN